jgi:hypothetical protein
MDTATPMHLPQVREALFQEEPVIFTQPRAKLTNMVEKLTKKEILGALEAWPYREMTSLYSSRPIAGPTEDGKQPCLRKNN